ncbi:MAG: hypothetical protein HZB27_07055 [Meiothermus silvanus]|nr:hypothetical protein [Allomeiothermus silvanus]
MLPLTKLRALLWNHLWRAVSEEAPEVLDDLRTLQPVYAAAVGAIEKNRVYNWFSLERACHDPGCDAALLQLRDAIRTWAGRWSLSGPAEPLEAAFSALTLWQVEPTLPFGDGVVRLVDKGEVATLPPELPVYDPFVEPFPDFEHRARTIFEEWLRDNKEHAALVRDRPEIERHARWLALRIKGCTYSKIIDLDGLPISEDTVQHAVKRLTAELGLNQL